jgi:hypothetical protein
MRNIIILLLTLCTGTFFTSKAAAGKITAEQIRTKMAALSIFNNKESVDTFLTVIAEQIPLYRKFEVWNVDGQRTCFFVETDTHFIAYEYSERKAVQAQKCEKPGKTFKVFVDIFKAAVSATADARSRYIRSIRS